MLDWMDHRVVLLLEEPAGMRSWVSQLVEVQVQVQVQAWKEAEPLHLRAAQSQQLGLHSPVTDDLWQCWWN